MVVGKGGSAFNRGTTAAKLDGSEEGYLLLFSMKVHETFIRLLRRFGHSYKTRFTGSHFRSRLSLSRMLL
jgi:hypothetical protein